MQYFKAKYSDNSASQTFFRKSETSDRGMEIHIIGKLADVNTDALFHKSMMYEWQEITKREFHIAIKEVVNTLIDCLL